MKLIKHMIFVDVDDESKLIINSLMGTMDEIDIKTYNTIARWQPLETIAPENSEERELYESLNQRGYLVEDDAAEKGKKQELLEALRSNDKKHRESYQYLTFIMTYDCNFRCPYCFEGEATHKTELMTTAQIDAALNHFGASVENILLFGGEPLLPKTREVIEYLYERKPDVLYAIITNGYYVLEFMDILKKMRIDYIQITLDGTEEVHNRSRCLANGEPTFAKIMAGIEKCLQAGFNTKIRMNLSKESFDTGMQIQQDLLQRFDNNENLSFEIAPLFDVPDPEKLDILSNMFTNYVDLDYAERAKRNVVLASMSPVVSALATGIPVRPLYNFCYAHDKKFVVDPYGRLFTCLVSVGKDGLEVGTYYPALTFKDNSIINRNIDSIPECSSCIYSLLCGGGCAMRLSDFSDCNKPACTYTRKQIHELLPRFYKAERAKKQRK